MCDFDKKLYMVTGAGSGIGADTVLQLNKHNAVVIAVGRSVDKLLKVKDSAQSPDLIYIEPNDLTENLAGLGDWVVNLKNKYGKFAGLVCCAGIAEIKPVRAVCYEDLKKIFDINFYAPVMLTKAIIDKRNNIGEGTSVVAISSVSAICSDKGHLAYSSSKAALSAAMRVISHEVIQSKIRVNCVMPSNIKTPMTEAYGEEYVNSQKDLYPLGFGSVEDVSNLVLYLLSDKAKFISGQNYVIDSGGVI